MKHVVVFARRPRLGRVKTRLAADIGAVEALRFYRTTLDGVCRRLAGDGRWTTWLGVTPDDAVDDRGIWPKGLPLLAQGPGDLGARMRRCLVLFGRAPALIVGSDIPDLGRHHVAEAFAALGRNDFVFGPADDGGYWLVGAAQGMRAARLFDGVRWSGPHALADTLHNAGNVRVAMLAPLADIDDGAAYRTYLRRK